MPAMEGVATQLERILAKQLLIEGRKKKGFVPRHDFKHMIIEGPPGTGKSTLAESVAQVMANIGATDSSKLVSIKPTDIEGEYVGEASKFINERLKETEGGVLFVDEAHQFANNEYTKNALKAMVATLADPKRNEVIIIAGYPKDIHEMLAVDPGLESRFKYRMAFDRWNEDQLFEGAEFQLKQANFRNKDKKAERAMEAAMDVIATYPDHASGRDVDYMISGALDELAARVRRDPKVADDALTVEDWKAAISQFRKRRVPA